MANDPRVERLRKVPLFTGCTEKQLAFIATRVEDIDLPAGKVLTEADERKLREDLDAAVREAIAAQEAVGPPALDTLIDDVYAEPPWHLREQLDALRRTRRSKEKR